jgi:hypothetical protein
MLVRRPGIYLVDAGVIVLVLLATHPRTAAQFAGQLLTSLCVIVAVQVAVTRVRADHLTADLRSRSLTFMPDGIRSATDLTDEFVRWATVRRVARTRNGYMFQIEARKCVFVPSRAFTSQEQEAAFVELVAREGQFQ